MYSLSGYKTTKSSILTVFGLNIGSCHFTGLRHKALPTIVMIRKQIPDCLFENREGMLARNRASSDGRETKFAMKYQSQSVLKRELHCRPSQSRKPIVLHLTASCNQPQDILHPFVTSRHGI
jgi:hypothetical protein